MRVIPPLAVSIALDDINCNTFHAPLAVLSESARIVAGHAHRLLRALPSPRCRPPPGARRWAAAPAPAPRTWPAAPPAGHTSRCVCATPAMAHEARYARSHADAQAIMLSHVREPEPGPVARGCRACTDRLNGLWKAACGAHPHLCEAALLGGLLRGLPLPLQLGHHPQVLQVLDYRHIRVRLQSS